MSESGNGSGGRNGRAKSTKPLLSEEADVVGWVPTGLRVCAALSWRFLVVVAAIYVVVWLVGYLSFVVVPVAIALLLAALLAPAVQQLVKYRIPQPVAAAIVLIGGLGIVGALLTFVITQFTAGLPALQEKVNSSLDRVNDWLINGPLHLRETQIVDFVNNAVDFLQENQAAIADSALSTAGAVGEILTGLLLTLVVLVFFLAHGQQIWNFLIRGVPAPVRKRVDLAGRRGFASLVSYVRATAAVAVVDGVGIGIGLWIVGVPLAIPLATLVFLGAFIPIIGAVVTGAVAVLVALVTNGFVTALIVLAIVVGVMQLEGNVLQPLLLGRAVRLHPLAVILAITAGMTTAGITGALLSVPLLAVLNSGIKSLAQEASEGDAEPEATTAPAKRTSPTTPVSDTDGDDDSLDEPPSNGSDSARKEPDPA
ncbi:Predicted PurR-regulated permease PerM [Saccharomonospora viridis]|uniref:Membrane protein n=1 Tax=Saccharomonospora viridis TaxID=1852 RepID=A0A837DB07_9PSEU|nr:membrane protein [Saccharomonospora viridis]SFP22667.1 Predicted PurR-regulated permease PerM [Saccharomonospora viridis]